MKHPSILVLVYSAARLFACGDNSGKQIPVVDSGALRSRNSSLDERKSVARQIGEACEHVGFFMIENHGVDGRVVDATWCVSEDYFTLPLADKVNGADGESVLMADDYPYMAMSLTEPNLYPKGNGMLTATKILGRLAAKRRPAT